MQSPQHQCAQVREHPAPTGGLLSADWPNWQADTTDHMIVTTSRLRPVPWTWDITRKEGMAHTIYGGNHEAIQTF